MNGNSLAPTVTNQGKCVSNLLPRVAEVCLPCFAQRVGTVVATRIIPINLPRALAYTPCRPRRRVAGSHFSRVLTLCDRKSRQPNEVSF